MRFLWILVLAAAFASCERRQVEPETRNVLGTTCTVNLYESGTEELYARIFRRLDEIDARFNPYSANSEISRVNDTAWLAPAEISGEFRHVLEVALDVAEATDGAFDPSLGIVVDLWGETDDRSAPREDADSPERGRLEEARVAAGWRHISLGSSGGRATVSFPRGMKLDLGGIVKGYAADSLAKMLREEGVPGATVNLGGNVYVIGEKRGGSPWFVGIRDPQNPEGLPAISLTGLRDTSIVTSGVYGELFLHGGRPSHHIIDPATGEPVANDTVSLTVICPSSIYADALSTALLVMGADTAFERLEALGRRLGGSPMAIAIRADGRAVASKGLRGYAAVLLNDYTMEFR